jgi:hypothetical protein
VQINRCQATILKTITRSNVRYPLFQKPLQDCSSKVPMTHNSVRVLFEVSFLVG